MRKFKGFLNPVQNSHGLVSGEFIFSLVMCVGFCIVLFSLTFTLSMAEVAQYIAFSSSRAHAAGHLDQDKQEDLGTRKFKELVNSNVLRPLFNNPDSNWFKLTDFEIRGGGPSQKNFENEYQSGSADRIPPIGVRFTFIPKLLTVKLPFLGSTEDENSNGFSSKVTGFLIREPTQKECWELQIKNRYSRILDLDTRYKESGLSGAKKYNPMEDNGC
ncbi:MAG: hypothetical protein ACXVCP_13550 [Bdellovibrio sp.]